MTLRNSSTKRTKETGAIVHRFDVLDHGERIGIASIIHEESSRVIHDFGHVCVTLTDQRSTAPLPAKVGKAVFETAYQQGLKEIRVVIPCDHPPSIAACALLNPSSAAEELRLGHQQLLAYRFLPDATR